MVTLSPEIIKWSIGAIAADADRMSLLQMLIVVFL
jgi:hypothetical protein